MLYSRVFSRRALPLRWIDTCFATTFSGATALLLDISWGSVVAVVTTVYPKPVTATATANICLNLTGFYTSFDRIFSLTLYTESYVTGGGLNTEGGRAINGYYILFSHSSLHNSAPYSTSAVPTVLLAVRWSWMKFTFLSNPSTLRYIIGSTLNARNSVLVLFPLNTRSYRCRRLKHCFLFMGGGCVPIRWERSLTISAYFCPVIRLEENPSR